MKQGQIMIRSVLRDDGYGVAVVAAVALLWLGTERMLTQSAQELLCLAFIGAALVLRMTALRRWHIRVLPWTLDGEKLTVGDKTIPLAGIRSVRLERATFVRGSYTLAIRSERTLRLCSLARGSDYETSVKSLQELGNALLEQTGLPA